MTFSTRSNDPAQRRLRAGILVTRFLRRAPIRTGTAGRVCGRPVDTRTYRMFLAEHGGPSISLPEPAGEPNEPITGVWAGDADAFARWVNDVTGAEPGYRLPSRAELDDPAVQRALAGSRELSVWLDSASGRPELWTPAGADQSNVIDAEILTDHLVQDLTRSIPTFSYLAVLNVWDLAQDVLAFARDRSLDRSRIALPFYRDLEAQRGRTLDVVREIIRNGKITRELALADTPDLEVALSGIVDAARRLDVELVKAKGSARGRQRAALLDPWIPAGALAGRLQDVLKHFDDLAVAIDRALDLARTLALEHDRTLALALAVDINITTPQDLGPLYAPIRALRRKGKRSPIRSGQLARELTSEAHATRLNSAVSLDAMADSVRTAREQLSTSTPSAVNERTREMAGRLEETMLPIATRQRSIDTATATATSSRIAALCLAAHADKNRTSQHGDLYREIAAAITLLERRTTSQSPPKETIMLASS